MVVLTVVFGLPIASFAAILARRWLAVLPLLVSVALGSAWIAYCATDWIGPHNGPAMLWLYVLITLSGWSVLVIAVSRRWQPPPAPTRPQ